VAYIEDRTVAWTGVYGEQSPGVAATGKTLYNMASLRLLSVYARRRSCRSVCLVA